MSSDVKHIKLYVLVGYGENMRCRYISNIHASIEPGKLYFIGVIARAALSDIIMMSGNKVQVAGVLLKERCKVIRATTREPIAAARYTRILGNEPYKKEETC